METPTPRRSGHRTQWAAQFAVASELCKLGYEVAFTMGNHPSVDIMATSPSEVSFGIDVKGLYRKNFWSVRPKPFKANLFYIFTFVPDAARNRFFILTQEQVLAGIALDRERVINTALAKGRPTDKADAFPGVAWSIAENYENAWSTLPA